MKTFKIHFDNGLYADSLIVEAETVEECREKAFAEAKKRGWDIRCCWSEEILQPRN